MKKHLDEPAAAMGSFSLRYEMKIVFREMKCDSTACFRLDGNELSLSWLNDVNTAATRAYFATHQQNHCIKRVEVLE